MQQSKYDLSFTQNRELSWLAFNSRVLEEAQDEGTPLLERMRFMSIFTSNLDEFFMIRVGSLLDLKALKPNILDNKSGLTAKEQLQGIHEKVRLLQKQKEKVHQDLEAFCRTYHIRQLKPEDLHEEERGNILRYLKDKVFPFLSPQLLGWGNPFPHLHNLSMAIMVHLERKNISEKNDEDFKLFGIIQIPDFLSRIIVVPRGGLCYVLLEEMIAAYCQRFFPGALIKASNVIRVCRNADVNLDAQQTGEYGIRMQVRKILKKRDRMAVVRVEIQGKAPKELKELLKEQLKLRSELIYETNIPLSFSHYEELEQALPKQLRKELSYPPFTPRNPPEIERESSFLKAILKRDYLLSFPFESMEPFLRMLKEASDDPYVYAIKITVYRLAKRPKVIDHLIRAAQNGKEVTVIVEYRARFDEERNINWAKDLEEAGCQVLYGIPSYKVHCKICLILRKNKGQLQYITQIGTGNYNESTAKQYTDYMLFTANATIGNEALNLLRNIAVANISANYGELLVAPKEMKKKILFFIDEEISKAEAGLPAYIFLKMNSLTDRELIDRLSAASNAGVKIEMMIRGICCLLPGIKGHTENIEVHSIVGRFLEHSRVYCFGKGTSARLYIASADFMTRNTENRIEVACPVKARQTRERIFDMIAVMMNDTVKARRLSSEGVYQKIEGEKPIDSQRYFLEEAEKEKSSAVQQMRIHSKNFFQRFKFFKGH